jgi:V/A-type H+-transporting ATPase subunit E
VVGLDAFRITVRKVTDEALQEMTKNLDDAYKSAIDIVDAKRMETIFESSEILEENERQGEALRRQITRAAELAARNRHLQLVEEEMNRIFKQALKKLEEKSIIENHKTFIRTLLLEGIEAISFKSLVVSANKHDLELLRRVSGQLSREKGVEITVEQKPIECSGGIKVRTPDSSILYDNTFEARIERVRPFLRKQIVSLFGG